MTGDTLWQRLRGWLAKPDAQNAAAAPDAEHAQARMVDSLRRLLDDATIPPAIREELAGDFGRIESMLERLERGELHVAVFGRVSAGKSALGNALLGREAFTVGVLHGTTTRDRKSVV